MGGPALTMTRKRASPPSWAVLDDWASDSVSGSHPAPADAIERRVRAEGQTARGVRNNLIIPRLMWRAGRQARLGGPHLRCGLTLPWEHWPQFQGPRIRVEDRVGHGESIQAMCSHTVRSTPGLRRFQRLQWLPRAPEVKSVDETGLLIASPNRFPPVPP